MKRNEYICENCKSRIIREDEELPDCCGHKMKPVNLSVCTQPEHAEHARFHYSDDPCDDGRAGERV